MSFKSQVAGTLKGKVAKIPFYQLAIFPAADPKLHPVAGFHLKRDIIGGGRSGNIVILIVVMLLPLADHTGRHGEPGRVVVVVPLHSAPDGCYQDDT